MKHAKAAVFLSGTTAIILILVPFHAFLTVWFSSFVGHYTLLRLWKEFLLVIVVAGAIYILLTDRALLKKLSSFAYYEANPSLHRSVVALGLYTFGRARSFRQSHVVWVVS